MSSQSRVLVIGATGATGGSIVNGLIRSGEFVELHRHPASQRCTLIARICTACSRSDPAFFEIEARDCGFTSPGRRDPYWRLTG